MSRRALANERAQLCSRTLSLCDLLKRFLIFGNKLKKLKSAALERILRDEDECIRAVDVIVDFASNARVAEMEPLLYAYARIAHRPGRRASDIAIRKYAFTHLSTVCTIPTHLFAFLSFNKSWGELKKNSVRKWYTEKDPHKLAFLITKYQHRQGWRHKDVLALAHVKFTDLSDEQKVVFRYIKSGVIDGDGTIPQYFNLFHQLKDATSSEQAVVCIEEAHQSDGPNLVVEHVPNRLLNIDVWKAMLEFTGLKRLVSSLHLLTNMGLFTDDTYVRDVVSMLTDSERLSKSKLHPMSILVAWRTYSKGVSIKGKQTWFPHADIASALETAFYMSFDHVEPTGLKLLYALDISGSMGMISTKVGLTCLEMMMCLVMVMLRVETDCKVVAFCHELIELDIGRDTSLNDLIHMCGPGGSTNCCLAFDDAKAKGEKYDGIVMWTDNDHNSRGNPKESIESYREALGTRTKAVVVGLDGNNFDLLPHNDPLSLNLAGGDAAMPQQLNEFLPM